MWDIARHYRKEGWLRHQRKYGEATEADAAGVVFLLDSSENHPGLAISRCFAIFLNRSATPPCTTALLCPTSFAGHGGIEDNWRESRSPLLAQGGVAAPIKKMPRSLLSGRRRGGWFKPPIIGS